MIGDTPAVYKRLKKSKTSWTESYFEKAYNELSKSFKLRWAGHNFNTFDFWLMPRNRLEPVRLVELKYHQGKNAFDRPFVGCDAIKIQRMLSLSIGSKAYIFHLFEDQTLIQNCKSPIERYEETTWHGDPVLLALVHTKHTISIPIAASHLRLLQEQAQIRFPELKNLCATAQET